MVRYYTLPSDITITKIECHPNSCTIYAVSTIRVYMCFTQGIGLLGREPRSEKSELLGHTFIVTTRGPWISVVLGNL